MKQVVLATGNAGKVKEIMGMLQPLGWHVTPQTELFQTEAVEDGLSFIENALIKARYACAQTGLPAIADDSGIEVAALHGQPGIYSSRYAGEEANDQDNIHKMLAEMAAVADGKRQASFYCAMAFCRHEQDPTPLIALGQWHGEILHAPVGSGGFGYDPIFYLPDLGVSSAELSKTQKSQISHRALALHSLVEQIKKLP
ncbi:MAG: RdgB/HAM1 family non-canonical purine NTP pyrophosphatase [Thiotrichales bacterium]|nr:RdgB/HAM1 family non-canonical purine NTP pyrophosphatase [Thiotrichales bacterium]